MKKLTNILLFAVLVISIITAFSVVSDNGVFGTYVQKYGMPGIYNSTEPTLSDGDGTALNVDVAGNVKMVYPFSYAVSSTATSTQAKTGAGFLHCVTINTDAAGALVLRDSTAKSGGTIIATIEASAPHGTYCYDVAVSNGINASSTAAVDFTLSYR